MLLCGVPRTFLFSRVILEIQDWSTELRRHDRPREFDDSRCPYEPILAGQSRHVRTVDARRLWQTGTTNGMRTEIPIPTEGLGECRQRWQIAEFRVFGSALRQDFRPGQRPGPAGKIAPNTEWSLLDHVAMEQELTTLIGRSVDVVSQNGIERSST
jgi:uncharacterized protein